MYATWLYLDLLLCHLSELIYQFLCTKLSFLVSIQVGPLKRVGVLVKVMLVIWLLILSCELE